MQQKSCFISLKHFPNPLLELFPPLPHLNSVKLYFALFSSCGEAGQLQDVHIYRVMWCCRMCNVLFSIFVVHTAAAILADDEEQRAFVFLCYFQMAYWQVKKPTPPPPTKASGLRFFLSQVHTLLRVTIHAQQPLYRYIAHSSYQGYRLTVAILEQWDTTITFEQWVRGQ